MSNRVPDHLWFPVILRDFRNQNVKRVIDSAALVMHDVMIASYGRPNQALPWERWVGDGISRVPILAWFCELAIPAAVTKGEDYRRQIARGPNLVETRGIL